MLIPGFRVGAQAGCYSPETDGTADGGERRPLHEALAQVGERRQAGCGALPERRRNARGATFRRRDGAVRTWPIFPARACCVDITSLEAVC